MDGGKHLKEFRLARDAPDVSSIHQHDGSFEILLLCHVYYLIKTPHWQLYIVIERGCMAYGFRSDNMVEGFFSWILQARFLSVYYFRRTVIMQAFNLCSEQATRASKCTDPLTPYARHIVSSSLDKSFPPRLNE
jgi:hypothetical protein